MWFFIIHSVLYMSYSGHLNCNLDTRCRGNRNYLLVSTPTLIFSNKIHGIGHAYAYPDMQIKSRLFNLWCMVNFTSGHSAHILLPPNGWRLLFSILPIIWKCRPLWDKWTVEFQSMLWRFIEEIFLSNRIIIIKSSIHVFIFPFGSSVVIIVHQSYCVQSISMVFKLIVLHGCNSGHSFYGAIILFHSKLCIISYIHKI